MQDADEGCRAASRPSVGTEGLLGSEAIIVHDCHQDRRRRLFQLLAWKNAQHLRLSTVAGCKRENDGMVQRPSTSALMTSSSSGASSAF